MVENVELKVLKHEKKEFVKAITNLEKQVKQCLKANKRLEKENKQTNVYMIKTN